MKEIGIIVAMEEEKEAVVKIMTEIEEEQIYNLNFIKGKIKEKKCILVKSGIGKVNAARTTQIMIQKFDLQCVINLGAGGAINDKLEIGDILIGKKVVQHDFDITAFDHNKGFITDIGVYIECNKELLNSFEKAVGSMTEKKYNIKSGVIATGDIFCTETYMKNKIKEKFDADIVDMECAAIGQVCFLDNIPFVSFRSVSDTPNEKNASTFDDNLKMASDRCAKLLKEIIENKAF